jgi:hypothetical protein
MMNTAFILRREIEWEYRKLYREGAHFPYSSTVILSIYSQARNRLGI